MSDCGIRGRRPRYRFDLYGPHSKASPTLVEIAVEASNKSQSNTTRIVLCLSEVKVYLDVAQDHVAKRCAVMAMRTKAPSRLAARSTAGQ